jgi:hypothetical protein
MHANPETFERLGAFYLGREYDVHADAPRDDLLLYDSKDLMTHAVCVGMAGSGKTGRCISLLEEAGAGHAGTQATSHRHRHQDLRVGLGPVRANERRGADLAGLSTR